MRLHRFYVNKPLGEELVVERAGDLQNILHQWTNVFRFKSGDRVLLFSSITPGKDFLYEITSLSKEGARLGFVSCSENIQARPLTLAMAIVKKDTFETVVRQATELGVSRIIPVSAARSEKKNLNFERLLVIATEAAEQSGRGTVPEITPIYPIEEAIAYAQGESVIGSLQGGSFTHGSGERITVWVGPEGGWTPEEEGLFENKGFRFLTCADTVLKADTAAVALLSRFL